MASGQQYDSNTLPLEDLLSRERTGAQYCQPDGFTCVVLVCSLLHVYLSSPNLVSAIYFGTATSTFYPITIAGETSGSGDYGVGKW